MPIRSQPPTQQPGILTLQQVQRGLDKPHLENTSECTLQFLQHRAFLAPMFWSPARTPSLQVREGTEVNVQAGSGRTRISAAAQQTQKAAQPIQIGNNGTRSSRCSDGEEGSFYRNI